MKPDYSKPLNDMEKLGIKAVFKKSPTFCKEGFIRPADLPLLYEKLGFKHTPEQFEEYLDFANRHYGGIITWETCQTLWSSVYDYTKFGKTVASTYDKDGDGYIDTEEFLDCMKLMQGYMPSLKGISFSDFLKQADTDNDGKVSVDEFSVWLKKLNL